MLRLDNISKTYRNGDFKYFSFFDKALVESADHRVMPHGSDSGHVQVCAKHCLDNS